MFLTPFVPQGLDHDFPMHILEPKLPERRRWKAKDLTCLSSTQLARKFILVSFQEKSWALRFASAKGGLTSLWARIPGSPRPLPAPPVGKGGPQRCAPTRPGITAPPQDGGGREGASRGGQQGRRREEAAGEGLLPRDGTGSAWRALGMWRPCRWHGDGSQPRLCPALCSEELLAMSCTRFNLDLFILPQWLCLVRFLSEFVPGLPTRAGC